MSASASSSKALLQQLARRVGSARGAVAVAASSSARRSAVPIEERTRANASSSGSSFAGLAVGSRSCGSSSGRSSKSRRSEATPQPYTSSPVRPPRRHLPASTAATAPLYRLFSSSSQPYASSTSSATSDQLDLDRDSNPEEPPEQRVRRAWSQALATRRAQWSQSSGKDGGGGSRSALPKEVFDVSFTRSQGPGGQNVNKVNTKANVRLLLAAASSPSIFDSGKSPLPVPIPREVVSRLVEKSTYYTQATHSLLVSSESLRTQEGNLSDAIEKLLDHLHQHATADLINPTPLHQKEKVQRLIAREKGKLKKVKSQRSAVKSGRRDKGF